MSCQFSIITARTPQHKTTMKKTLYTAHHPYQGHIIAQDYNLDLVKYVANAIAERTCADIDIYANVIDDETDTEEMQLNAYEGEVVCCTNIGYY